MKDKTEKLENIGWVLISPQVMAATDISAGHKIILGKILGLLTSKGYCWASNRWLGKNTGFKQATVSEYITDLVGKGYLFREIKTDEKKRVIERHLFPVNRTPPPRQSPDTLPGNHRIPSPVTIGDHVEGRVECGDECRKVKSKDMQRDETAPPSPKKRRSLKDCSRADVIDIYEQDPTAPPKGLARPQVLAAVLDHTEGFDDIIIEKGWPTIMMRLGQMFNGHRKVSLEYRDLVGAAIDLDRIPGPPHGQRSLNYLIGALTGQAQERRARRFEDEAQRHKVTEDDDLLSDLASSFRMEAA